MIIETQLCESWREYLQGEFRKDYFKNLQEFVARECDLQEVYPKSEDIFRAFNYCPPDAVKVVILGQDPYHGQGQANGLCFSVNNAVKFPPSLRNIFKELESDVGCAIPESGDLSAWSERGVLLLNATLTVRASSAGSHQKKGWETFTDAVINLISAQRQNVVFMLWGSYAQKKGAFINREKHLVLEAAHPSPLAAYKGFFGCRHFSKANEYLQKNNLKSIDWCLSNLRK